jgi:L-seryl-tRNA(Ser) seleniumtransferase
MKSPQLLRNIPSVSDLLENPALKGLVDRLSHNVVVGGVRSFLEELRSEVEHRTADFPFPSVTQLAEKIARRILEGETPSLKPVINATGILLHTGLGRAPLAQAALEQIVAVAEGYCDLEFDLERGERSDRMQSVEGILRQLTGAEAALVVNNNAAATLLALSALARGREVIVSRGQLVEIGGSYRLPDVMAASGALLREVGTTNKTRESDYRQAINDQTAALLRVHTSNYRIVGFTSEVGLDELVRIGKSHQLPVIDDIGSGALIDFSRYGCCDEPMAAESIAAGADLVLMSGDKLLGGPQAGIAVGRRHWIDRMKAHPLARAVRVDKLTLAALSATLRLYRDEKLATHSIPLLTLLGTPAENLRNRAERLAPQMAACRACDKVDIIEDVAYLGGGSMPAHQLPTWCLAISPRHQNTTDLAKALRTGPTPVVARIHRDRLVLDLRSVFVSQDAQLVAAVEQIGSPVAATETPITPDS